MKSATPNPEQLASDIFDLNGDFRKMTKAKVVSFVSDMAKMPTETARLVIEQAPTVFGNATASVKSLFDKIPAFIEDDAKTHDGMMGILSEDDRQCWERINNPDTSDAERDKCYERLESNKNHARNECSDKRSFKMNLYDHSGVILLSALGLCVTVLGVNGKIPIPGIKK
ncbi:hypothetical protein [Xiamenia xianingshaonis]|uniref:Uncharacterized protein n=1 Tax=Xiamenia xianingshaonis TaxID=2682776 RepID=A0A9E6MSK5_9ACTN|nr:hypothetical protein [Xiamenia xianingshaonis]NHM14443.1 hypothetical protein [Xiamenia xianingshaonis]QTU84916.1 hypothetical protein J7S26_03125 [Xiamenia xianingshaonis]